MSRRHAEKRGRLGEDIAAWWLRLRGWRIVGRRVKTRQGELDLIARRGRTLAFIEVKTRGDDAGLALAIDEHRLRRVAAAAETWASRHGGDAQDMRIDVILMRPWKFPLHLPNVWHG